MIFPRPFAKVGSCIAIVQTYTRKGELITHRRPLVKHEGKFWKANRLSYCLNVEEIPRTPPSAKDGLILHKCGKDWCINFKHLYKGTQAQNVRDFYKFYGKSLLMKLSNKARGRKHTEETKLKISRGNFGKIRSEAHRRAVADSNRRRAIK